MTTKKYIICYIEEYSKFRFFSRMRFGLENNSYKMIYLTNRLSIWLIAGIKGFKSYLIKKYNTNIDGNREDFESIEYLTGKLSLTEARILYQSVLNSCLDIHKKYRVEIVFIFGGASAPALALKDYANRFDINKLFFELSNIRGKVFVDKEGTNALSSIYSEPELLDEFEDVDENSYLEWRQKYLAQKINEKEPNQAKLNRNIYFGYIIDILGFYLLNIPNENKEKILDRIRQKHFFYFKNWEINGPTELKNYYFFPLQVENDAQLIIHSKMTNIDGLKIASQMALDEKVQLLVKIHPAETRIDVIKEVINLQSELNFRLVSLNTIKLVNNAKKIITINSTVGLEALILNKDVVFLGNSFFAKLNPDRLRKYIMSYLIPIEYFDNGVIDTNLVSQILSRVKLLNT